MGKFTVIDTETNWSDHVHVHRHSHCGCGRLTFAENLRKELRL